MQEWDGIANGDDISMAEKKAQRHGLDLPEEVDRDIRQRFGIGPEAAATWRIGGIDIRVANSQVMMKMTDEQARVWQQARRGSKT